METPYPDYDVLDKWASPSFDAVTREVIRRRIDEVPERRFFTADEFRSLRALAARLTAQEVGAETVPIAPWIDAEVFEGRGAGFRHADMPPEPDLWRIGLAGLDAEARRGGGQSFADLSSDGQDATLRAVQSGEATGDSFAGLPPNSLFNAMLSAIVGVYYAHPDAWSEIGFGGPASPRGYVRMGLDERDPWEAQRLPAPRDR